MTEFSCSYGDSRDEAIVAYLYADSDAADDGAAQRALFETHLPACPRCRAEVASLRGVRAQLARWSPPEPSFGHQSSLAGPHSAVRDPQWWRAVPVWAQVAAAMLFLGVSAGIANLDVRYDRSGLSLKTGWSQRAGGEAARVATPATAASAATDANAAPWKADIAALESQLKNEMRAAQTASAAAPAATLRTVSAPAAEAELTRRVRALVEESEKRQQRELALRIAELVRDVNAQRQADLVKIDRTLGVVQNSVGIEVMKTRQQINQMDLTYRASQRQ
jgi:hypothetical protein